MSYVESQVTDGVTVLRLDNPPGQQPRPRPAAGTAGRHSVRAEADASVGAIVIIGSGKGFSGGADIREFGTARSMAQPNLPALLRAVEDCSKPVVAAIDGICMGGGLELALACHYRVAVPAARLALPEVKLGLLPGAGGTQRLPRLVGVETALNMIVSGSTVAAEALKDTRLFDLLAPGGPAGSGASEFAKSLIAQKRGPQKVRDMPIDMPNAEAFLQFARNTVKAVAGPYPAPLACVEGVAAAVKGPFEAGLRRERELFAGLMASPESAALRHIFQAERAAGHIRGVPESTAMRPVNTVGVIGAGTMGGGITMALINAGVPVVLAGEHAGGARPRSKDHPQELRGRAEAGQADRGGARAAPGADHPDARLRSRCPGSTWSSRRSSRRMQVKEQVFRKLDAVARPGAILASNTSALDLNVIAGFTRRPQDVDRPAFLQSREPHAPAGGGARGGHGRGRAGHRHGTRQEDRQDRRGRRVCAMDSSATA